MCHLLGEFLSRLHKFEKFECPNKTNRFIWAAFQNNDSLSEGTLIEQNLFCLFYRYKEDRHKGEEKSRPRERERREHPDKERERHQERYDRYSESRKRSKKSPTPPQYPASKSKSEAKESTTEHSKKKDREYEDKVAEEKKKDKKIKDKKRKRESDDLKKEKKKRKKDKKTQKETAKEERSKRMDRDASTEEEKNGLQKLEDIKPEEIADVPRDSERPESAMNEDFGKKLLARNPEPPEFLSYPKTKSPQNLETMDMAANPPNPNFPPVESRADAAHIDSLYAGLDDTEIQTVITEKHTLLSNLEEPEQAEPKVLKEVEKSPKKDEFLADLPELSKWERDETVEKSEVVPESSDEKPKVHVEENEATKVVTSEVLKRAENAIFQKAINAIRPIEIKKISDSRKVLYQNPEAKVAESKNVNVTINVGRNERNVEITEPVKKAKLDRSKFKPVPECSSPARLSAKERLGDKVVEEDRDPSPTRSFLEKREVVAKVENLTRSRSPKASKEKRKIFFDSPKSPWSIISITFLASFQKTLSSRCPYHLPMSPLASLFYWVLYFDRCRVETAGANI